MNFKIEINYLNIDNYPSIEAHFENMASKGWLITKVLMGSLFVYEKIEPQALDFSISPYEVETAFTRKTKDDLEEFQTVSEMVGWQYAAKSYDLHIYYKAKASDAIPLHTDEEEEFKSLNRIAKRYLKSLYISLPLLLFLTYSVISSILNNIRPMKDGFIQILALALPFGIVMGITHIIDLRRFTKENRKNIEQGNRLTFNSSNQWIYKISFLMFYLIILVLLVYLVYSALVLANLRAIIILLPLVVGGIIGLLYRAWIKPLRKGLGFKLASFLLMIVIAAFLGIPLSRVSYSLFTNSQGILNPNDYQVLKLEEFMDEDIDEWGNVVRNTSFLLPSSHQYISHFEEEMIQTEYSKALTESLGENLVERYIKQAHNRFRGRFSPEIDQAFSEGEYHPALEASGFTEADFQEMYEPDAAIERYKVWEIIEEESITDASEIWNVDEGYFLNYEKAEVVLRDGKEVFYLAGFNFSDPAIVENAKLQLQMDQIW